MTKRSLRDKVISKQGLLVAVVVIMIGGSLALYLADIDWEQQVSNYRYLGVFIVMLVSSMTIILPLPGIAVLAAAPSIMNLTGTQVIWLAVVASIGASLGELTSYFAGRLGGAVIAEKHQKTYGKVEGWTKRHGGPAIFIFSATPLPFDLAGIAAGSLRYPLWKFFIYCWAGRLIKCTLVVYAGWRSVDLLF
ncbi:MAG: VTT domain-containing protein [Dehalococcoidia bacterium]